MYDLRSSVMAQRQVSVNHPVGYCLTTMRAHELNVCKDVLYHLTLQGAEIE